MILLCALFRLAHCIMFPPQQFIIPIFRTLNKIEQHLIHSVWICYQATEQFITSFLPLATTYFFLIISSRFWCLAFRIWYWTKFYYVFVSHGRPLWEILKDPGGENSTDDQKFHQLHQSSCCRGTLDEMDFSFRNKWESLRTTLTKRTIHVWKTSLMLFGGFPTLNQVIFNWYANALFFFYFVLSWTDYCVQDGIYLCA
jgi:hypothetical protein